MMNLHGFSNLPGKPMGMLEDENKNLWISTENGLVKYNLVSNIYRIYNNQDGFQGNQFTKAHYKLKGGEMMFGSISGFSLLHPDSLQENNFQSKIQISDAGF